MTSISSSQLPISLNGISSTSQISANSLLLGTFDSQQNQNTTDGIFGSSYSLNLSDSALNALYGGNSTNDVNALLNELGGGNSNSGMIQYTAGPVVPTSLDGSSFQNAELADGGPLPAFLAYVDQAMHLNSTQAHSLDEIATEFQNAPGTQATVDSIAAALAQAGIPETYPAS
jgi:hypothetical protein